MIKPVSIDHLYDIFIDSPIYCHYGYREIKASYRTSIEQFPSVNDGIRKLIFLKKKNIIFLDLSVKLRMAWQFKICLFKYSYKWLCFPPSLGHSNLWSPSDFRGDRLQEIRELYIIMSNSLIMSNSQFIVVFTFSTSGPHQYSALTKKFLEKLTNRLCLWNIIIIIVIIITLLLYNNNVTGVNTIFHL